MIDTELFKHLEAAHAKIKIEVDGTSGRAEVQKANLKGEFIATTLLISDLSKRTNTSVRVITEAINGFLNISNTLEAESEEQFEVMKEIVKQNLSPEDLK